MQVDPRGPAHPRDAPAVVETDPDTWIAVSSGELTWHEAVASGRVLASGERTDLTAYLPLDDEPDDTTRPERGLRMDIRSLGFRTDLRLLEMTGSEIEDRGTHLRGRTPADADVLLGQTSCSSATASPRLRARRRRRLPRPGVQTRRPGTRSD